jgi:hypothetical protein
MFDSSSGVENGWAEKKAGYSFGCFAVIQMEGDNDMNQTPGEL